MVASTTRLKSSLLVLALSAIGVAVLPSRASAQWTNRYQHTQTLLPDGNIVITGGIIGAGAPAVAPTNTVLRFNEMSGTFSNLSNMSVARASHTAVLTSSGTILVLGGASGIGPTVVVDSFQIFDPMAGANGVWQAAVGPVAVGLAAGQFGRINHTATVLQNGNVLICGGENAAGTSFQTCVIFNPYTKAWSTINMLVPRTKHTAVLMFDGSVLISGGVNSTLTGARRFLASQERYRPGDNAFTGAGPLRIARAGHSATVLGDGRVLFVGGNNGEDLKKNRGTLQAVEIYAGDVSNTVAPMQGRKSSHGAVLDPYGRVTLYGGLGNVTTTYITPSFTLNPGSVLRGYPLASYNDPGLPWSAARPWIWLGDAKSFADMRNTTALQVDYRFQLGTNVSGTIAQGEVLFSTPSIAFPGGFAYLIPGDGAEVGDYPGGYRGLRIDLAGVPVWCDPLDLTSCGWVSGTANLVIGSSLGSLGGTYGIYGFDRASVNAVDPVNDAAGCIDFIPQGGGGTTQSANDPNAPIDISGDDCVGGNSIRGNIRFSGLPTNLIGYSVSSGTLILMSAAAQQVLDESLTWNIDIGANNVDGAVASIPTGTNIVSDGAQSGETGMINFNPDWELFKGEVSVTTTLPQGTPVQGTALNPITMSISRVLMRYVATGVDVGGEVLSVDLSTVIIRSMVFGDIETYDPKANAWTFGERGGATFDNGSTLAPTGSSRFLGGQTCWGATCTNFYPTAGVNLYPDPGAWTALPGVMSSPRGNHSTTLLPNGKMLVAGGNDGQGVVKSADLLETDGTFVRTGDLVHARELHSATLLPNGRVLVAGGFSTDAVSTGATNTAEIYYPETGQWIETGVMASSRDSHVSIVLPDGNVMVFGGYNRGNYLNSAEIYYSTQGVWRTIPTAPGDAINCGRWGNEQGRRANHTGALLKSGEVLFVGGVNSVNDKLSSALLYNPNTNGWRCADDQGAGGNSMYRPNYLHSMTHLPNGNVVVHFGDDGGGQVHPDAGFGGADLQISRLYVPPVPLGGAGTWSNAVPTDFVLNNPLRARIETSFNHASVLLPNGVTMVTGGAQDTAMSIKKTYFYDIGGQLYNDGNDLGSARSCHTLTLSSTRRVVAIGGFDGGKFLNNGEYVDFSGEDQSTMISPPSVRIGSIKTVDPELVARGKMLTIRDANLHNTTEGSTGRNNSSSQFHPRLYLQAVDGTGGTSSQGNSGFLVDLTTRVYNEVTKLSAGDCGPYCNPWTNSPNVFGGAVTNSSITVQLPETTAALPNGWYHLRLAANAQFSDSKLIRIGPPLPTAPAQAAAIKVTTYSVVWQWAAPVWPDPVIEGYDVFYATSGTFISTVSLPTGAPLYSATTEYGLTPNVTACILVSGFGLAGDGPLTAAATTFTLSTVPVSVFFSTVEVDSLVLTWDPNGNSDATIYEVSMSTDDLSTNGKQPFTTSFSTPTEGFPANTTDFWKVDGLSENTTYYFRVRAQNLAGLYSNFSAISSATTRANVLNLEAQECEAYRATTCLKWVWKNVPIALKYRIYNSTVADTMPGYIIGETAGNVNSYMDLRLSTSAARSVRVSAFTPSGEGPLSGSATGYTLAAAPVPYVPSMTTESTGAIVLQWWVDSTNNPIGTSYVAYYSTTPEAGAGWQSVVFIQNSFGLNRGSIGNLAASTLYYTSMTARNPENKESGQSSFGSTATWPTVPTNLTITAVDTDRVSLAWDANENTSSTTYEVTASTDDNADPDGNGFEPFTTNVSTKIFFSNWYSPLTATIGGLDTGKKYWFRVQAQNMFGVKNDAFSTYVATRTSSGAGASAGSLGGILKAGADTTIAGTIGSPASRTVSVYAPANAFNQDVAVIMSTYNAAGAGSLCSNGVNVAFSFSVDPPIQPIKPITVSITYSTFPVNELGALDPAKVSLMRYDPVKNKCVPVPTTVDTASNRITMFLNHLSFFQVAGLTPATSPQSARAFPNPFYKGRDGFVTFSDMPGGSRVRIFTLRGDLIWDRYASAGGILQWYGLNMWGRTVASGVYLVAIQYGSDKKIMKVVVLR
ncbi:MAG: fibronectin type III domain-containing protein [Elusimicrobia bacterium]|nr:fibronectin type III domain-containing protein [Elusimicrobiota bacterium]